MRHHEPSTSKPQILAGQRILLVEDDDAGLSETERQLQEAGADVLLASTAYQAVLVASQHSPTAAVIDVEVGADTIERISAYLREHGIPVVLMDSLGDSATERQALISSVDTSAAAVARLRMIADAAHAPGADNSAKPQKVSGHRH
jgi:ActR/RegA family two-component response regulator